VKGEREGRKNKIEKGRNIYRRDGEEKLEERRGEGRKEKKVPIIKGMPRIKRVFTGGGSGKWWTRGEVGIVE